MQKSREKYLREYINQCQARLRMQHWVIDIDPKPADEGDVASIFLSEGQHHGKIRFHEDFWGEPAEDKRNTIGHELTHCKTRDLLSVIRRQLVELLGTGVLFRSIYKLIKDHEELLVDDLATIFEAVLPPWEGPK